jgi:hypothetical protein
MGVLHAVEDAYAFSLGKGAEQEFGGVSVRTLDVVQHAARAGGASVATVATELGLSIEGAQWHLTRAQRAGRVRPHDDRPAHSLGQKHSPR